MDLANKKKILQIIPKLDIGGAEEGTIETSIYMTKRRWKVFVVSKGGSLVNRLVLNNVTHINMSVESKNPIIMIFNIFRLMFLIKKYKIKIVHVRSRAPAWSAFYACKFSRGVKFITTVHGAYQNQNEIKRFYNSIMIEGNKVIAISKYIKKYLIKNFKLSKRKKKNIVTIPRGVSNSKFNLKKISTKRMISLSQKWEAPDGIPIILFPSRIASFKGHKTLLKALSILKKDPNNKFTCIMLGATKNNSDIALDLTAYIKKEELSDNVKFPGKCNDMPAAYKLSDIVVSPADKPEGFGRIILEAQAMKRPVIASAHGGSLELIKDNYNGFLFTPKDEYELANKIKHAISLSKKKKLKLIKNAKINKENFNIEKMCESNYKLYNSLIN